MSNENQNQEKTPFQLWVEEFQGLIQKAREQQLYAPDVLFMLNKEAHELQHMMNCILFTHEHKVNQEEGE